MSSISAGTTSGTALVSSGDTTGALLLQTNGTTTAVTIATNQVVTLAQPLPVGSGGTGGSATPTAGGIVYGTGTVQAVTAAGTSGQYLTSAGAGAPTWATLSVPGAGVSVYTNVTTATTYTLTSASNATIEIDAQAFGIKVVLPNATTLSASGSAYLIRNVGNFPILIEDSTNVAIGGVPAGLQVQVGLNSIATAAGSWILNQDACFATEVAQTQTSFNSTISQLVRISSTLFAIVAPSSGFTVAIQGFSISGDTVTSGTLTGVSASGTFVEARAVTGNRLLVTTFTGSTFSSFIVDLTTIASPTVGTAATISTTAVNTLLKFDQKPVNDINVTETAKTTSGNLTGTNIYVYLYRSSTLGTWKGNSIDVGASGTTGTVGTEYSTGALGATNTYITIGATVITSSTIGFGIIFNSSTTGTCYAFTVSISGGVWSANSNNFLTVGASLASSQAMTYSSRALILATRTGLSDIYAIEFPASGNAAPTTRVTTHTGADPTSLALTASRIIIFYLDAAIETIAYTFGTSIAVDQYFTNTDGTAGFAPAGVIDTSTCNTLTIVQSTLSALIYVSAGVLNYKKISASASTGGVGVLYGFQSGTTNFLGTTSWSNSATLGSVYAKIMRGTTSTTPDYVVKKNYGQISVSAPVSSTAARYYFNLGKYLVDYRSGNQTIVPVSATATNGFVGSSGFKDFQMGGGVGAQQSMDIDSSRAMFVQLVTNLDSGTSALTDPTTTNVNVRFSLVRVANV